VEESYISADSFKDKVGVEVKMLLKTEVPLLQGLGFDLVVYSPYRALHGLFQVRHMTPWGRRPRWKGRQFTMWTSDVPDHSPRMVVAAGVATQRHAAIPGGVMQPYGGLWWR
jgi:hypothetical protein